MMKRLRRALWLDPGEFEGSRPVGEWWGLPTWRKLLVWIVWRPPTWIDWAQKTVRWKIANALWDRFGRDLPGFRVPLMLGLGRQMEHENQKWAAFFNADIVEVHEGPPCSCPSRYNYYDEMDRERGRTPLHSTYPHHLTRERHMGPLDRFSDHAKAYYALDRPGSDEIAQ